MKYATTGIDIGTESIRVCILENDTKENTQKVVSLFKYKAEGLRRGQIINENAFKKIISSIVRDIEKQLSFKIENVCLSVGAASLESSILTQNGIVSKIDGEITHFDIDNIEKQLDEQAEKKSRRVIFSKIIEYKVDGKLVENTPEGMRGVKIEIKKIYISMSSQQYDLFETILFENDIELLDITPKGVPSSEYGLTDKQKIVGSGYLDIGAETTTLTVFENGSIIGFTTIGIGSNDITNDIALVLKISLEEAELVKNGTSTKIFPRKKIDEIINSRIEDISELTNNYLKKLKKNELLPGGIILSGGGSELTHIEEQLKKSLKLPIKKITFEIQTEKRGLIKQADFLDSYGITLMHFNKNKDTKNSKTNSLLEKIKNNSSSFFKQFLP